MLDVKCSTQVLIPLMEHSLQTFQGIYSSPEVVDDVCVDEASTGFLVFCGLLYRFVVLHVSYECHLRIFNPLFQNVVIFDNL